MKHENLGVGVLCGSCWNYTQPVAYMARSGDASRYLNNKESYLDLVRLMKFHFVFNLTLIVVCTLLQEV